MRRRAVLTLVASCFVVACASQGQGALPGLAWSLYESEGEGAKLAYGAPASDNVVLMLTCQPHSGQVMVSATTSDESALIRLKSAGQTGDFFGEAGPSGIGGGAYVEASAPADHPALARFARTGELSLEEAHHSARLPVRIAERGRIRDFFAACQAQA
ncbi:hypothetical protein [Phenylobacterium sp.]|jgi:hypothetical protein|uniref:hypothetical protein n=1 Tax=Phenylobacterium sp. TaxID=1871053 RepID=UPI002E33154C|nr:hypothetical protein [Phenylobacterium sp.]HEX2562059.1 hypothetical protein [Phenylobacterium sp.]